MSALSRIRNNIGLVAIVIFVALAAFILTDFLSGISSIFNAPPPAAVVAGQEITNQEFERRVSDAMQQYQGAAYNDQSNAQIRDNVFNQLALEKAYEQEFDKIGLMISDEELISMMGGDHIPQAVLSGFFGQEPNNPNMTAIVQTLKSLKENENGKVYLRQLEEFLLRSRPQERYANMIRRSFVGSGKMAAQQYVEQNKTVDVSYLSIPYSSIPDSSINVSIDEIDDYISNHPEEFKLEDATAYVRYLAFDVNPSSEDSASARKRISNNSKSFAAAENDSLYTRGRIRNPFSNLYKEIGNVNSNIRENVLNAENKTVWGPFLEAGSIQTGGYYKLFKLVGTETNEKPSVEIDHILVSITNGDTAAARSEAADLARQARGGGDFAELAKENSDDPISKLNGGKVGWYPKGQFGNDFEEAVEGASVGSIVGPLMGKAGFHVVKITDKTNKRFKIAEIEEEITPSSSTKKQVYLEANQFVKKAKENGDLYAAAQEMNKVGQESPALTAKTTSIPGLNGGRNIAVWALNNDVEDVSSVLKINQDEKYVIAQVVRKYPAGLQSSTEILTRENARRKVLNEKKAAQIKSKLGNTAGQDLNAIQTAYGAGANVASSNGINFSNPRITGIGNEPLVQGTALGLAEGATSGPIAGNTGVFIVQATKINEPAAADAATLANLKSTFASQAGFSLQGKIGPSLLDVSDIKDTRADYEWLVQRQGSR